jgi:hypothetical protein
LALRRHAYHSSSLDYNSTAQLVTNGIKDTQLPSWVSISTSQHGTVKKHETQLILDRHFMTSISLDNYKGWIQIEMGGGGNLSEVDSIHVSGGLRVDDQEPKGWACIVLGSDDGDNWKELAQVNGDGLPGDSIPRRFRWFRPANFRRFNQPFDLQPPQAHRFYRINFNAPNATNWNVGEMALCRNNSRINIGGPYHFTSAWMSAGKGKEWVYVDLGAVCTFDRIVLHWIRRAAVGALQVSNDANNWKVIMALPETSGLSDDFPLERPVQGRYVRVIMEQPASNEGYILSEMEVYGRGGLIAVPKPMPKQKDNGRMDLAGGVWRIQRESLVSADGETLSQPGFQDNDWIVATVPATALMSYVNVGALPDPNFGDNQLMISESFFYSDFWYRTEFMAPALYKGKYMTLNFDGINWKAEVFLNGKKLGRIEGGFIRGHFDVTDILIPGQKNALAVRIEKNATPGFVKEQTATSPGANGGELGADNPTYHASIGWDWIPTIRGRNIGIWNDVYLTVSGPVTIENPFITTDLPLPDTS